MDLSMLGITGTTALLLMGFVMGAVEFVKAIFDAEWRKAVIIGVAGVAGGVVAPLLGVSIVAGIVSGFAGSGFVTLAQNVGKTE